MNRECIYDFSSTAKRHRPAISKPPTTDDKPPTTRLTDDPPYAYRGDVADGILCPLPVAVAGWRFLAVNPGSFDIIEA
jgi:hypothetical protein